MATTQNPWHTYLNEETRDVIMWLSYLGLSLLLGVSKAIRCIAFLTMLVLALVREMCFTLIQYRNKYRCSLFFFSVVEFVSDYIWGEMDTSLMSSL